MNLSSIYRNGRCDAIGGLEVSAMLIGGLEGAGRYAEERRLPCGAVRDVDSSIGGSSFNMADNCL